MEGRARCAEHQERHQVYGRIFVSLEEQKENLQPCSRRGCPEARFDAYKYCKDHYEERTEDMHLYGLKVSTSFLIDVVA